MQKTVLAIKPHSNKRKTVILSLWVNPQLKAEIKRLADKEQVSVSKTGAALLEEAIRQQLHVQHAVLLQPIIEQAIAKQMQGMSNRLAWLLVRIAFDVGQIRGLSTNILGRQQGVNEAILKTILQESSKAAKMSITRRTPQLTELMDVLEQWLHELDEGRKDGWQSSK
jgi:hypothetical protein